MPEEEIGIVSHWFGHISVAGIKITKGTLRIGDSIHIKGHTTDLTLPIQSLQLNHQEVSAVKAGDDIGLKVSSHVREHDKVYKVTA